jgi:hypothetical protein
VFSKNIDRLIAGSNFLSLVFGLTALSKGESCLILDDPHFNLDNSGPISLDQLKVELIQTIGERYTIAPLKNIERYIAPVPLHIIQQGLHICLGRTPWENLFEIERKLFPLLKGYSSRLTPLSLDSFESVNRVYLEISHLAAGQLLDHLFDSGEREYDLSPLLTNRDLPFGEEVKLIGRSIQKAGVDWLNHPQFAHIVQTISALLLGMPIERTQQGSPTQIALHAHALLSPTYQLDSASITKDLIKEFALAGGIYKQSNIKSSAIHQQQIWAVELDSFDGIYHPGNLHLFDSNLENTPFSFAHDIPCYESVVTHSSYTNLQMEHIPKGEYIIANSNCAGESFPLITVRFQAPSSICTYTYLPHYKGNKVEFVREKVSGTLDQVLWDHWGVSPKELKSRTTSPSRKVLAQRDLERHYAQEIIEISPENLVKSDPLQNCFYLGPLANSSLGNISLLLDSLRI